MVGKIQSGHLGGTGGARHSRGAIVKRSETFSGDAKGGGAGFGGAEQKQEKLPRSRKKIEKGNRKKLSGRGGKNILRTRP